MFLQVLLASETIPCTAVAVGVWTHQWLFGIDVLFVNLALMSQKPTRVCEPLNLVTPWFQTLVGAVMFIHVFVPFTRAPKCWRRLLAFGMITIDLAGCVLGWIPRSSDRQSRTSAFHEARGDLLIHLWNGRQRVRSRDKDSCRYSGTFTSWAWIVRTVTHIASTAPPLSRDRGPSLEEIRVCSNARIQSRTII